MNAQKRVSALSLRALVHETVLGDAAFENDLDSSFYESIGFEASRKYVLRTADEFVPSSNPQNLDVVKFLCKNVWPNLFGKKIDKLQSNKDQTMFVLQDSGAFSDSDGGWLSALCSPESPAENLAREKLLSFSSGLVRGALSSFGAFHHVIVTTTPTLSHTRMRTGRDDASVHYHQDHSSTVSYTITLDRV